MVARVLRTSSIFAVWLFAYLLSYFYRSANAVIASDLRADVGLSNEQLGFMTSLFYLAFAVTQLPLGAALDRWGSRTVTSSLMLVGAFGRCCSPLVSRTSSSASPVPYWGSASPES